MKTILTSICVAAVAFYGCGGNDHMVSDRAVDVADSEEFEPAYVALHRSGELRRRAEKLWNMMENCTLCPRMCEVNRLEGERGFCRATSELIIASYAPHFGEEAPLVGRRGSGTIFFSHCALRCVFCINYEVAHGGKGTQRTVEDLAQMMLHLQRMGTHNINVVTPTHYSPHILLALDIAAERGLRLPLVYNTCGWENMEILKMLDGVVDIYLPDFKYFDAELAGRYSSDATAYPQMTQAALLEMHRQVGTAYIGEDGLVRRGLMLRHLVMPTHTDDSKAVVRWVAEHLPKDTYFNIMSQYTPMFRAFEFPEISRRLTPDEYRTVMAYAESLGLTNLDPRSPARFR